MVSRVNLPMSDDDFQRAKEVKDRLGLTWEEFIIEATDCLDEHYEEE